ncbi:DUF4419 domain-containing protein [Fibrobacter sp.]|jgi:hypothetical protein|uniref:DUF4419 domain-containing protein n=1 Tax=Fibrobacter sp. TaxID=35828 RepID=UPI003864990D
MNKIIFILFFAIGLGTAAADAIVKDKKVKESKPKYAMTEIMDFDGQQVLLEERTDKKFIQDLYIDDYKFPHPFVAMIGTAFANHHSIEIYPDDIWLLIMDGIRLHVKYNRDKFKDKFVKNEADTNLVINDNALTLQSPPSAWKKNIAQIYDSLYQKLPEDTRNTFDIDFSTSTAIDKFVAKATLMSISSEYFSYSIHTLCGIPQIIIKGKKRDWQKLKDSFDKLALIFDMPWWAKQVDPILNEFIQTFNNKININFWRGIYKYFPEDLSCGAAPHINGWITKFFPYIVKGEQEHRTNWDEQIQYKDISAGKNDVFITWKHLGNEIYLLLSTGFWGVTIDPKTKRLRTIRGYALTKDRD